MSYKFVTHIASGSEMFFEYLKGNSHEKQESEVRTTITSPTTKWATGKASV